MAASEKEEKEDGMPVEVLRLISISKVDVFLCVGEQENDGTRLETAVSPWPQGSFTLLGHCPVIAYQNKDLS